MIQLKIKNRPDCFFNDNMIVNIKDFDSSLLEINKLSFKGIFSVIIHYIKYITTKSSNGVSIDRTDNDEDFFFCFLMVQMDTFKNTMELNIQFLIPQIKIKKHEKITKSFEKKLKEKLKQ